MSAVEGQSTRGAVPPTTSEPVAVIGMGCRLAGDADSPDAFWNLLAAGRDGIGRMPEYRFASYHDRGPEYAAAARRADIPGGFLREIAGFDAGFFGLTPREAELMDPQQRLLLEVAWEALEHAGVPPTSLAGGDTGVFVGIGSDDYGRRLLEDLPQIEAWTGIGSALCAAANRVSYALDLHGPSMAVDTACSASLVATHLACQSLRAGESGIALVGGVNLIVSPALSLTLESAGATAPDGRCKSFDAEADGYGRGEGGAVLVLKRLRDAERDGDRVHAVILGSEVRQEGRTNGIMAPSGTAQRRLLEETLHRAGVPAGTVDYVETHGTGTRLGDPLEAGALSAVYGSGRPAGAPLLIGSVKPNVGHLEAGAGAASLLKAILALGHGEIPPSLNHTTGNPGIDWDTAGLRVVTGRTPWPDHGRPRRAGVSGFGYGGTIAHVILEQGPDRPGPYASRAAGRHVAAADRNAGQATGPSAGQATDPGPTRGSGQGSTAGPCAPGLFPVSGRSPAAVRCYAGRLADWLAADGAGTGLDAVGHTLALRRSHLETRAGVVAEDRAALIAGLTSLARGEPSRTTVLDTVPASPGRGLVWVFSGHGSQWEGMGRELLTSEPAFAAAIDELEPVYREELGLSPRSALLDGDFATVDRAQALIFAVQTGLAAVWRSYGVRPDAVIGHSVGEIAAAVCAGALTVTDGARLICRRSALLRRVAGQGAMAMVDLSLAETTARLADRTDVVAAISASPGSTVVSGDVEAVGQLVKEWEAADVQVRRVASDVAFHSPQMDPLLAELEAAAAGLTPRVPDVPVYRTALADPRTAPAADGAYWAANLRNTVRLAAAVQAAAEDGYRSFLEVSAHPVVAHSIRETLADTEDAFVGSTLRRDQPERTALRVALAALHARGVALDWRRLHPAGHLVTLPGPAWQRQPHWRESSPSTARGTGHDVDSHTLLGARTTVPGRSMRLWHTLLDDDSRPYPGSHTINGTEIVPAAVLLNTFLAATDALPAEVTEVTEVADDGDARPTVLTDVALRLPLTPHEPRELQVMYEEGALHLASRAAQDGAEWLVHTTATAGTAAARRPLGPLPPAPTALAQADPGDIRRHLASVGVPDMGFGWQVDELLRAEGHLQARVRPVQPERAPATWAPLFDAALSIAPSGYPGPARLRMVAGLSRLLVDGAPPEEAVVRVAHDPATDTVDVLVAEPGGRVLAALHGVRYAALGEEARGAATPGELVHELAWRPLDQTAAPLRPVRDVVLVGAVGAEVATAVRERLTADGGTVRSVEDPAELAGLVLDSTVDVLVLPTAPAPGEPVPAVCGANLRLLLGTAQRLARPGAAEFPRLWAVTTGVRESRETAALAQAGLWGLARVIAGEHGELWGGVVDLPARAPVRRVDALLDVVRAAPRDDVVSLAGPVPEVARLVRTTRPAVRPPVTARPDGTYLITGGLGTLGLEVARWLAERGARRLVLVGRTGLPPRSAWDSATDPSARDRIAAVRALEARGVTVRVLALDVTDAAATARALSPDTLGLPPVRGIVHAAGVLDNRLVPDVDEASLDAVLRPKVTGAWVLHELFPPGSLEFFVHFSSCGQLLGMPGQASYGAANAFLDALTLHRNATAGDSQDTTSFGWTSWHGQGMAVNQVVEYELRERGVTDISPAEAFGAWDHAARCGPGHYPVLRTVPLEPGDERLPLLREIAVPEPTAGPDVATAGPGDGGYAGLSAEALAERLRDDIAEEVAGEMRLPLALLDTRRSLVEQGLDSVMTLVVRRRLERRFGHKLPATLLWHQPTVESIARHVTGLLAPEDGPASD